MWADIFLFPTVESHPTSCTSQLTSSQDLSESTSDSWAVQQQLLPLVHMQLLAWQVTPRLGSRASEPPILQPRRWVLAFSLVTEPRKKCFHCSLSRDLNRAPYEMDRGRFLSPSLIWETLTFKVHISSHRHRMPEEERDSNTWNT